MLELEMIVMAGVTRGGTCQVIHLALLSSVHNHSLVVPALLLCRQHLAESSASHAATGLAHLFISDSLLAILVYVEHELADNLTAFNSESAFRYFSVHTQHPLATSPVAQC